MSKLELTWVGKDIKENLEPRILILDSNKSNLEKDFNTDNMLIHGDNLLALKALEKEYLGKIKCIYIDPPFNTGAAFEYYDDNLEHSIWIDLMHKRIKLLYNLLMEDGVLAIEIDDGEMPYLRIVLDEIFGRDKFVANICVKSNNISGQKTAHKDKTILRNKDNIIIYKKGKNIKVNPQYIERNRWDTHYNMFIERDKDDNLVSIVKLKDKLIEEKIIEPKGKVGEDILNNKCFYDFILKYKKNICRFVNSISKEAKEISLKNKDQFYKYNDETGKVQYAYNGNRISFLEASIINIDGNDKFSQLLGDMWVDIDFQNTQNEGKVSFPNNKKPEALIRRILDLFTEEGDLVLDSFLGSGTTAAVAHKMKRRWIGIEMGEHAYTHCKVRLDCVVDGIEPSGITQIVKWNGGGGYRFYELAPTLINIDDFGEEVINKTYSADMLASAVALHEGFTYNPDDKCFWKQSYGNENSYLYVTTNHLDSKHLDAIKDMMKDDEYLIIACKSYDNNIEKLYNNIKIKKIPQMLLHSCEYGKNNYNLNIINPPIYDDYESEEDDE